MQRQPPPQPATRIPGRAGLRGQAPTPARPRGRSGVIIAALLGIVLALALAVFLIFGSRPGTASLAAQHFCDALVAHDYASVYAQLTPTLQRQGTEELFAASQQELDALRGPASACAFADASVRGTSATFVLTVTRARSGAAAGTLRMLYTGGAWRVAAYDSNVI
ncbi:MAG TPA: hypothetical protein VID73_13250 [Ktedonobacterales bacterium]|jgi:hypothetical protein